MYLLYCDETNLEPRDGGFFVYGGVSIPEGAALSLSHEIDAIRSSLGVDPSYRLKFNPGPGNLGHDQFIELKKGVIESAIKHDVKLFTSLILHDIASSPNEARRFGINTICYHFDCYLSRTKSTGLVLIDRFDDGAVDAHLVEKFSVGITGLPYTSVKRLGNIVGFHYSAIGQSNFTSIVDIVLGSLRFCINGFTRQDKSAIASAKKILPLLSPLFFREDKVEAVSELGAYFGPKEIKVSKYRERYDALKVFLSEHQINVR